MYNIGMNRRKKEIIKTIKMTLAAVISILIANFFGVKNSMTAGVIALITITNTRDASVNMALTRFWSTVLGFFLSWVVFSIFGFDLIYFGLLLLIYIPLANFLGLEGGVSNSVVLITHFILAKSVSLEWIFNEFLILIIGGITALVINYVSPSNLDYMEKLVDSIEEKFIDVLSLMNERILNKKKEKSMVEINDALRDLEREIKDLENLSLEELGNQKAHGPYYFDYSKMRESQLKVLSDISRQIEQLTLNIKENKKLSVIFVETKNTFDESNDALDLMECISDLYRDFRNSQLPKTREEFEDRARLFTILNDFETFLELKKNFSITHKPL